jgi:hypothetical protein
MTIEVKSHSLKYQMDEEKAMSYDHRCEETIG